MSAGTQKNTHEISRNKRSAGFAGEGTRVCVQLPSSVLVWGQFKSAQSWAAGRKGSRRFGATAGLQDAPLLHHGSRLPLKRGRATGAGRTAWRVATRLNATLCSLHCRCSPLGSLSRSGTRCPQSQVTGICGGAVAGGTRAELLDCAASRRQKRSTARPGAQKCGKRARQVHGGNKGGQS